MKKILCIVLICAMALSLIACGSGKTSSDTNGDKAADSKNMSQSDIIGNYVEQNTGAVLRVKDEYVDWTRTPASFSSKPSEGSHNYKIEGNQLTTPVTEEGWDSFDITPYGSGYSLSNDVYTFIPYDDYYTFEHTTVNKVGDKASGGSVSVTLEDVAFQDSVDILDFVTDIWVDSFKDDFILEPPEGQCFVKLQFIVENEGKETLDVPKDMAVALVYDKSYVFNSYETTGNTLVAEPMNYCYVKGTGDRLAGDLNVSPLSSRTFTVYMLCPTALKDNIDKPLYTALSATGDSSIPNVLVFNLR